MSTRKSGSAKRKKKRKKKKKLQKSVDFSSSIDIDQEIVDVWDTICNHDDKDQESNYMALIYGGESSLVLFGEDSGGPEECIEDLDRNKSYYIISRACCIDKTKKTVRPINVVILWTPKGHRFEGLSKGESHSLMSFHLDYVVERLKLSDLVFVEAAVEEELTGVNLSKQIKEKCTDLDVGNIIFNFSKTVQQCHQKFKKNGFSKSGSPVEVGKDYVYRCLCASFLYKEGGGTVSYSIKKRWHQLHSNFRVGYYTGRNGKMKGEYAIVGSRVGKGHPNVWKKKGGIKGMFGKKKKDNSSGTDFWFFINTPSRCYCCNALNEKDLETWLRTLELMGCVRKDCEDGSNLNDDNSMGRGSVGDNMDRLMGLSSMIDSMMTENNEREEAVEEEKAETRRSEKKNKKMQVRDYEQQISLLENKLFVYEERFSGLWMENKRIREENKQLKGICGLPVDEEGEQQQEEDMFEFMQSIGQMQAAPIEEEDDVEDQGESEDEGEESSGEEEESSEEEDEEESSEDDEESSEEEEEEEDDDDEGESDEDD